MLRKSQIFKFLLKENYTIKFEMDNKNVAMRKSLYQNLTPLKMAFSPK